MNAVSTLDDVKLVNETVQQSDPTCCRLYDVCGVSQAHEIKLVETPGLLVRRLHRVLPPLVNHLISWVSICNYTEHVYLCVCVCVCVCVTLGATWHILMMDILLQTDLGASQRYICLVMEAG